MRRCAFLACLAVILTVSLTARADDDLGDKIQKRLGPRLLFKKLDTNGDGKLSQDEFKKIGEFGKGRLSQRPALLDRLFNKLDTDKDGFLSLEEFKKLAELRHKKKRNGPGEAKRDHSVQSGEKEN